jgi:hypothetical protein
MHDIVVPKNLAKVVKRLLFVIDVEDVIGREALGGHAARTQAAPAGCGNHFAASKSGDARN